LAEPGIFLPIKSAKYGIGYSRQSHALLRELKDAEQALAQESTEANEAWLRDVKARQADADGLDALIEGFGESSGRFQRRS
jgi:DNA primase